MKAHKIKPNAQKKKKTKVNTLFVKEKLEARMTQCKRDKLI